MGFCPMDMSSYPGICGTPVSTDGLSGCRGLGTVPTDTASWALLALGGTLTRGDLWPVFLTVSCLCGPSAFRS
jgi:hypothetical protein